MYPIHEQLYQVWRQLLNVQVTSTEEYPHLRPVSGRRGFVHKAIKVSLGGRGVGSAELWTMSLELVRGGGRK